MTASARPRCVIVVDKSLPTGLIANSAAVLGVGLSRLVPEPVGPDVPDASGVMHRGITTVPIIILAATAEELRNIAAASRTRPEVVLLDFTDAAQTSKSYDEYTSKLASRPVSEHRYLALLLCGERSVVGELTRDLPLLR